MNALLDPWNELLAKTGDTASLRPGASASRITRADRELGVPLPAPLRAFYAWHDGETSTGKLFDALCRVEFELPWRSFRDDAFEVRFMPLDAVAVAGVSPAWIDQEGTCFMEEVEGARRGSIIPFLWVRPALGAEDRERSPQNDDWFVGVDTITGGVWLYEPTNEMLEGADPQADTFDEWLGDRLVLLEQIAQAEDEPDASAPASASPARQLVTILLEKSWIELESDATPAGVAKRLTPLLSIAPRKRAVEAVCSFFENDAMIAELFVDDDILRKLVGQFTD